MDFFELVRRRCSIRRYTSDPVGDEHLAAILEATRQAPSAGNRQAYEVIVVRDAARRSALAQAALGQTFLTQAPLVLAFVSHPARSAQRYGERGEELYAGQDTAIAATYAQLAAHALGLGTVWVGAFDDDEVDRILEVHEGMRTTALLPVGHIQQEPKATPRRALQDLVREETLTGPPWNG